MIGRKIHTRIFCPVLLVIILLTLSAGLAFFITSEWYINFITERETQRILNIVEELAEEVYQGAPEPEDRTLKEDREYSRELLKQVKKSVKSGKTTGKLLVFNSKLKYIYPNASEDGAVPDSLALVCVDMLKNGELEAGPGNRVKVDNNDWNVKLFAVNTEHNVRAEYFVAAVQVPDMSLMWNDMGILLGLIAMIAICIAAFLIWLVAKSIARPLQQLCSQAKAIGEGESAQIQEVYSLKELETLKEAYNQMEYKIKKSEKEKERFFQNVSHDLRTPLASIIGYAQGIQCNVMKDSRKAAGIILSESMRMTNLVESILTLTKMDNQELALHIMEIDLEEFMAERLEGLGGIAENCQLSLEAADQNIYIRTDPELLGRIVQNLVSNCVRYAEHEVAVYLKKAGEKAIVLIEDDGPGFAPEDLSHIFDRFYQGENGKFGIGLSVVWTGIKYLGGEVEAGNRALPEHGAFYRLSLPL